MCVQPDDLHYGATLCHSSHSIAAHNWYACSRLHLPQHSCHPWFQLVRDTSAYDYCSFHLEPLCVFLCAFMSDWSRVCHPLQELCRMVTVMGQRQMADRAEAVLAVLSSARAEVLWWFQHWEEVSTYSLQSSAVCLLSPN